MKQLFDSKVLRLFFERSGEEFYVREVARECRCSPATASKDLRSLERAGLVERKRKRHATFYRASSAPFFRMLKIAATVKKIVDAGLVKAVERNCSGLSSLLLYGSAAAGEDDWKSDYDLLVIAAAANIGKITAEIKPLEKETAILHFTPGRWLEQSKKNRAFYLDVISNCIALVGRKPVVD